VAKDEKDEKLINFINDHYDRTNDKTYFVLFNDMTKLFQDTHPNIKRIGWEKIGNEMNLKINKHLGSNGNNRGFEGLKLKNSHQ
jgi:hypothetical protein